MEDSPNIQLITRVLLVGFQLYNAILEENLSQNWEEKFCALQSVSNILCLFALWKYLPL